MKKSTIRSLTEYLFVFSIIFLSAHSVVANPAKKEMLKNLEDVQEYVKADKKILSDKVYRDTKIIIEESAPTGFVSKNFARATFSYSSLNDSMQGIIFIRTPGATYRITLESKEQYIPGEFELFMPVKLFDIFFTDASLAGIEVTEGNKYKAYFDGGPQGMVDFYLFHISKNCEAKFHLRLK